jgi:hypothetical protein
LWPFPIARENEKKPWLEQTFCKQYHNVQMDDQVYMILQIIKQGPSEVV